jgi:protease I
LDTESLRPALTTEAATANGLRLTKPRLNFMKQKLKGRRIAALAADGFEKVELTVPMYALRLAGAAVDIISLRRGRIRGVNLHEPASRVGVDKTVEEADPNAYDALLLPGGFINPDLLRQSQQRAREFVRAFDSAGKPIASLCHGPWVLASAGTLQGRTLTSWPGIRDDLVNAGARWLDQEVVRDGNLVTSRGPQDLKPFVREVINHFAAGAPLQRDSTSAPPDSSSPQANEPPRIVLEAMRWMPRPSFRTIALIALAFALFAPRRTKKRRRWS